METPKTRKDKIALLRGIQEGKVPLSSLRLPKLQAIINPYPHSPLYFIDGLPVSADKYSAEYDRQLRSGHKFDFRVRYLMDDRDVITDPNTPSITADELFGPTTWPTESQNNA